MVVAKLWLLFRSPSFIITIKVLDHNGILNHLALFLDFAEDVKVERHRLIVVHPALSQLGYRVLYFDVFAKHHGEVATDVDEADLFPLQREYLRWQLSIPCIALAQLSLVVGSPGVYVAIRVEGEG